MTLLLDSSVLIDALRRRNARRDTLADLVERGVSLATSAINIAEVYAGVRSGEEESTAAFFGSIDCYPMTAGIARRAGEIKRSAAQRGLTFGLEDMIVAATALEHGLTVWTDNVKDFAVPGIVLYQPS